MTFFLNFRYQPVGGGIRSAPEFAQNDARLALSSFPISQLPPMAIGRHVVFAVHGYNNSQADGVAALSGLEEELALPGDTLFLGVLWPGDSRAGFISYPVEKPTASQTGRNLSAYCNSKLKDIRSFSFVSHSLGARVVLEAIRGMTAKVRSACIMAGAIERTCLEDEYADAFARVETVSVLASRQDRVLRYAFPSGNLIGDLLDPTSNPLSSALGFSGLERPIGKTVPPWQIDPDDDYGHGDYLPSGGLAGATPEQLGKWKNSADFARRAIMQEMQTWPPIPPPRPPRRGWWAR